MATPLLSVRNLVKDYPGPQAPLRVLDGVSFALGAGESLCVTGPSGSGKTTLLNLIGALDAPTSGEVLFDGKAVHALSVEDAARYRNESVGFVFQDHHLLPQCTTLENVLLPRLAFRRIEPADIDRGRVLLERVGLFGKADSFPHELSGGERQRVATARAVSNAPRLLLCDEPTGNLDSATAQAVASLFLDLRDRDGMALILVTHNASIAALFGNARELAKGRL